VERKQNENINILRTVIKLFVTLLTLSAVL